MATPAYAEIAATLAAEIRAGDWPAGSLLPTHQELMRRFNVSRITITSAMDELSKLGLVFTGYVGGRRGTIVRSTRRTTHYATDAINPDRKRSEYDAFSENAMKIGRAASKRFEMKIAEPPEEVALRLGIEPGTLVVVRTTHQILDGEPFSRETSYFPRDLAEEVGLDSPADITQGTIRLLADHGYQEIAHSDEVTDEAADAQDAADLSVPIGAPLLVLTRTGASRTRITRVTKFHRIGRRNRLVWEMGDVEALAMIRKARPEVIL